MNRLAPPAPRMHLLSLATALVLMAAGTLYPPLMADPGGGADHRLALALFWAMSAGFVRGVGFVPRQRLWRVLFSGWAVVAALGAAALIHLAA
jgi:predicted membrane protein